MVYSKDWYYMWVNYCCHLTLNLTKTEFILIASKQKLSRLSDNEQIRIKCLNCTLFCYKAGRQQKLERSEGEDTNLMRTLLNIFHLSFFKIDWKHRPFQPVLPNFVLKLSCSNRDISLLVFISSIYFFFELYRIDLFLRLGSWPTIVLLIADYLGLLAEFVK